MMLSRAAEDMFWTARYLERAANMARFLDVSYNLDLDRPEGAFPQWEPVVWITGDMSLFRSRHGEGSREDAMRFLLLESDYENSVVACLEKARNNAKGLREEIPVLLWAEINNHGRSIATATAKGPLSQDKILRLCREINRTHGLILGLVSETMARGEAYHLWQMGTYIERADKTSRMLHVKYFHLLPKLSYVGTIVDDVQWSALLQSLDAREDYHRRCGVIIPEKVIDMLVKSPRFARSIMFCLHELRDNLAAMPGTAKNCPLDMVDALMTKIEAISGSEIIVNGVHEFINDLQIQINHVNDAIMASISPAGPTIGVETNMGGKDEE